MVQQFSIIVQTIIDELCSETDHERYEADTGVVQLDMAQDLAEIGASCSDEALHMVRDWVERLAAWLKGTLQLQ